MKKFPVIFVLFFSLGLLSMSFVVYAKQTTMSSYYPSPSGIYTKVQLINQSGGPNEANFCSTQTGGTFINAGTIFSDPTTGYLEICKSDGSVASFPGTCFNRFGSTGTTPFCPANYQVVPNAQNNSTSQSFSMAAGNTIVSWTCCFSGPTATTIAKSGCFSIYSTSTNPVPASCSSFDTNAYDVGCDTLNGSDITPTYKRNCCFNVSSNYSLSTSSTSNAGSAASRSGYPQNYVTCGETDGASTSIADQSPPQCGGVSSVGAPTVYGNGSPQWITDINCCGSPSPGACPSPADPSHNCAVSDPSYINKTPCPAQDGSGNWYCAAMTSIVTTQDSVMYPKGTTLYYCP